MADTYVIVDGQLCRKFDSYEAVDLGQLELKVEADAQTLESRQRELAELEQRLEDKKDEVSEAERMLEDSKRGYGAAQALVDGESVSDEDAAGDGSEDDNSAPQSIHVPVTDVY